MRNPNVQVRLYGLLNSLLRKGNIDVYVTGSNSKMLSKDVATEFRGRGDVIEVHPLSFSEYYFHVGGDKVAALDSYLVFGGMPFTLSKNDAPAKREYLGSLFDEVYMRDMLPNMPHSRMPPTLPLRPIHPWPGVARGLGPRVKGRVLPDSTKSAPLTGGRFRRPAKTHERTPLGAHFSHRCRVWRPAGGRGSAGTQVACTGAPLRDRMRPRGADPCQGPAPRDRPPPAVMRRGACGTAPRKQEAIKHSARRASHDGPPRGARRRCSPGRGLGVGRHPTSLDYEAHWGA